MRRLLLRVWLALSGRDLFGWAIIVADVIAVLVVLIAAWLLEPGPHPWASRLIPLGWWYGRIS